ncbi:unnamed protein product [Allacma fusca]|uniref:AP-3 complex subunit delta n=1 Tax=Allacma fusca TaxID=39272 RepID=A0A8J2PAS1_9HEXA|nr:unnamed protein product [Allacma fusca]
MLTSESHIFFVSLDRRKESVTSKVEDIRSLKSFGYLEDIIGLAIEPAFIVMALKKVKGNFERIFDKNMTDLVRGIRNNKDSEAKYIAQCIEEIKIELKQDNIAVKANAVTKLAYLQMLGYDISWAGFNIIEVMSSPKFTHKRIGYLSASQCFHADQELLMLTTNMIRKDLNSQNQYEAGNALSALACFVSPDLARDLSNDILTLLTSTKPYLRKKGVLMLYKIFLKYPDALRPAFPRLKEKLEDPDPGVQSAAVNVICELARKNPKNYLSLAPIFFKLMTTSTNNWMLIKIIKLFGALTPLEPRLGKKLIEPLTNLIHSTSAMSLLYECINTTIAGMPNHSSSINLCVQKLRILIEDSDQNLKYLGLLAMSKILPTHPKSVQTHKDLVMRCLDDKDESIRLRALDLLYGMVNKKNLMEIVKKLLVHMEKAEGTSYRDELLSKIIQICSQNNYQHITNFEWYVSVLVELTRVEGLSHGELVASQMLDVAVRVEAIRPFAVQQMSLLLENPYVIFGLSGGGSSRASTMIQVLYAAAWISGEYVTFLPNPRSTLLAMLEPRTAQLPHNIQSVYLQNVLKILAHLLTHPEPTPTPADVPQVNGEVPAKEGSEDYEPVEEQNESKELNLVEIQEKLKPFVSSEELEVQERASTLFNIIKVYLKLAGKQELNSESFGSELVHFFAGDLNPVAPKAQKKVPLPEGLDLDKWINDPPSESEEEDDEEVDSTQGVFVNHGTQSMAEFYGKTEAKKTYQPTEEELQKQRETRRMEQELNPHYLKSSSKSSPTKKSESDVPPIAKLELNVPLRIPGLASSDKYLEEASKSSSKSSKSKKVSGSKEKGKKKKKRKHGADDENEEEERKATKSISPEPEPIHVVSTAIEMPEGATLSDNEDSLLPENDPHRALNIDLDIPLEPSEVLPVPSHRKTKKSLDPHYITDNNHHTKSKEQPAKAPKSQNSDEHPEEPQKTKESSKKKKKLKKDKKNDHEPLPEENGGDESTKTKKKKKKDKSEKKTSSKHKKSQNSEVNLMLDSLEEDSNLSSKDAYYGLISELKAKNYDRFLTFWSNYFDQNHSRYVILYVQQIRGSLKGKSEP